MCGILIHKGSGNDFYIRRRGQDAVGEYRGSDLIFNHYLLSVTGKPTHQPFIDNDGIVCEFNGEIYNYEFVFSDGENLIPLYKKWGIIFPKHLDGEYAIALYDFKRNLALFITDCFATKPLWRNGTECASYESGVGGHKIKANTIEGVEISTGQLLFTIHPYYHFDFSNQHKTSYNDCINDLIVAVQKRAKNRCFIGLSSGYDSGVLACILKNLGVDFKCYSVLARENYGIIERRAKLLGNVEIIRDFDISRQEKHLRDNAEEFFYDIRYDDRPGRSSFKEDYAAKALSHICELASGEGRKVCLSGGGADEITSDYSLLPRQSQFKGKFPKDLKEWDNFYGSCQYSYINKEECVGGSWNIETRYPFLDRDFIQEFLWLTPELKNRNYKAPLYEYLTQQGFPFSPNKKIGFNL